MHLNRISGATALGAALTVFIGMAASADTIYTEAPIVEKKVVVTDPTTVISEPVVVPAVPSLVEERIVAPATPVVEQQVITPGETVTKRSITIGTRKPAVTTESTEVSVQSGPSPIYVRRIDLMRQQLDEGVAKRLISATMADSFKMRLDSLTTEATNLAAAGTPKDQSDDLERKLTALNIEISRTMGPGAAQIGSGAQPQ